MSAQSLGAHGGAIVRVFTFTVLVFLGTALPAQVPPVVHHQGRVLVEGVHFSGTGQFKFALIHGTNNVTLWSNDRTSIAGLEPADSVPLAVDQGLYSVMLGDTSLSHMSVVPPEVFTNSDVRLRIWFNDGAHGFQRLDPDQRLGASGYAMVSASGGGAGGGTLGPGSVGPVELAPGAALANLSAGGYGAVPGGGLLLGTAAQAAGFQAAGYTQLGRAELADTWELHGLSFTNAPRYYTGSIWTGSKLLFYGGWISNNSPAYVGASYTPTTHTWTTLSTNEAPPEPRVDGHSVIWTGTEMIVWGGENGVSTNRMTWDTGGRYNPALELWTPTSTGSGLAPRANHAAVWTGTEMLLWGGGVPGLTNYADGARYSPANDSWLPMNTNGAPSARSWPVAVWTGTEMVVWGGSTKAGQRFRNGARYSPSTDTWSPMATNGAPSVREMAAAAWTGTEVVIWSGYNASALNDGARYNPVTDTWTAMSTAGAPAARSRATAVWTGTEIIVWGGVAANSAAVGSGARYSPASDAWSDTATRGAPPANRFPAVVWTGMELFVYGGNPSLGVTTNALHAYIPPRHLYLYQRP